ncbi:MAG: HAD family hydrolase [Coprobacillaceae bacterium]
MLPYLICSDIDGTLMTNDQKISKDTLKLINDLQEEGHIFYLATGRMLLSAKQLAENISDKTGVIASNGGIVSLDNKVIKHTLSSESSLFIYKLAMQYKLPLFIFSHDTVYYNDVLPDYFVNETNQGRINTGKQRSYHHIKNEDDLLLHAADFINAIFVSEDQLDKLKEVKSILFKNEDITVTSSYWNNIEISPKGISKAIAIQELQKYYSIPTDRVISFGDGGNDIEMFKVSNISVAVDNASEDVKKFLTNITSSNKDEGVYKFLKNHFRNWEK